MQIYLISLTVISQKKNEDFGKATVLNLKMLKKWTKCFGKGKVSGALLIDLVKAFDCLDHKLLLAKLIGYSLNLSALRLVNDFLSNRKQGIKIENTGSTWMEIVLEFH